MHNRPRTSRQQSPRRLLTTLAAICLPVLAAVFLSGSFFRVGTLRPGEVFDATAAHAAQPHGIHSSRIIAGGPTDTTTTTTTPGTTTTTPGTTGTTTPGATGTTTGTPKPVCDVTGTAGISITDSAFVPSSITVNPGTRVTWTNNGTQRHRVRDISHVLFDSDDLQPGQSFSYTFCNSGTYNYEDSRSGFTGVVIVSGSTGTGTPGATGTTTPGATGTTTPGTTGTTTPGTTTTGTPQVTGTPGGLAQVNIFNDDGFSPANITVQSGTTVRWTNYHDDEHTVTSPGNFNSGDIHQGQSWQFTFVVNGTYNYFCAYHAEMQGTVTVIGGPTATPQSTSTPVQGNVDVNILNLAFVPQNVTISPGTTVRWTNQDPYPHTATADNGSFNSGTLNQGGTYSFTFNTPGTYGYYCAIHPSMRGTINVVAGGGGTPSATAQSTQTAQATGTAQTTGTPQATSTQVSQVVNANVRNYAFEPLTINVPAGTTVRWTNLDNDRHTVTSDTRLFDSGVLTLNQSWQYTFTTPGTYTYFCAIHPTMHGSVVVSAAATATPTMVPGQRFSDVFPSDYFYTPVDWLASRGIVSGYSDGTFRPYNNTTRGQVTKMVVLGEGWPIANPTQPTFSDVAPGSAFYTYIETAVQHNVITGYADNTFRPNNDVTRGQLTKIVVLAEGWTLANPTQPTFTDVQPDHAFYSYVETAVQHSIISGYADRTFRPGNNATRGQIAKIIYNALTGAQ
jgi:plastocyanin